MKISKLFHWLYAILMFLPFGMVAFNCLHGLFSPNNTGFTSFATYSNMISDFFRGTFTVGFWDTISGVYSYLIRDMFGLHSAMDQIIINLLTYWTCISIIWLIFDVFMYVPLLVHRWIDKAKIEYR